jgi:hypothetical protein
MGKDSEDSPQCGVCNGALAAEEAWECRACRRPVHAECCDGHTLERSPKGSLSSTCRTCRSNASGGGGGIA